ncbi:hypothetical protein JIQ42_07613 [Leishmania sp. Namibia]|uniref:hypothetical protein n=1 Tax=Leishmania sp. Namibia TaxID=2802991 RepID=UPI001B5397F8|nr:hypothetical protein JIQ42_07613 [Leishmania sp. Namibia]
MAATTTSTPYTRSSILAWANDVLETSYTAFQNIPSYEVGLLLYGVFHDSTRRDDAAASGLGDATAAATAAANAGVSLLSEAELHTHHKRHQATCMRYLQRLQFPFILTSAAAAATAGVSPAVSATESSAPNPGGTSASPLSPLPDGHNGATSAVAQGRNAEHVLAMIRELSAEEAELLRDGANDTSVSGGVNASNTVLLLGPSMTPAAWLSGSAFVEELKLWRWVRLMAERHRSSPRAIRRTIRAYLHHEVGVTSASPVSAKEARASPLSCAQSRGASPAPRSPAVAEEVGKMAEVERGEERSVRLSGKSTRALAEDETDATALQELKRMRPEMPPSTSPVPAHAVAAEKTIAPATLSVTPLVGSVSPVHAALSPIKEAVAAAGACTDNLGATGLSWPTSSSGAHTASATTITPYVVQAAELQTTLRSAQKALQNELKLHRAQQQQPLPVLPAPMPGSTSAYLSAGDMPDGTSAMHTAAPLLAPATNPCDAQEVFYRQHMVNTVFAKTPGGRGDSSLSSLVSNTLACDVCPSILAHAIQGNLTAIDHLEDVRARAIAACLKKDPMALLAALQSIV